MRIIGVDTTGATMSIVVDEYHWGEMFAFSSFRHWPSGVQTDKTIPPVYKTHASPRRNTYEPSPNRRGRDAAYESGCGDFSRY